MTTVEAATEIQAPMQLIWDVMLDLKDYGAWNPFIVRVDGCERITAVGQRFDLHVKWADGSGVVSGEQVTRLEPPSASVATLAYGFRSWMSTVGMVRAERSQVLEQRPGGVVTYRTREVLTGWGTRWLPVANIQDGFNRHAAALKARSEALVTSSQASA